MNLRIRRRRFGQLALASAATAAMGSLAGQSNAQTASVLPAGIIGAAAAQTSPGGPRPLVATPDAPAAAPNPVRIANNTPPVSIVNEQGTRTTVARSVVENPEVIPDALNKAVPLQRTDRVVSIKANTDGSLATGTVKNSAIIAVSHLIISSPRSTQPDRALTVDFSNISNKNPRIVLESLGPIIDGQYLCVVSLNLGRPPFQLAFLNPQTGIVTPNNKLPDLPSEVRISNLTQAPDGTIYGSTLGRDTSTRLLRIDLGQTSLITGQGKIIKDVPLTIKNEELNDDVLSLAFSPSGQLFALSNPTRQKINTLYGVDLSKSKGDLNSLTTFDVEKITFAKV